MDNVLYFVQYSGGYGGELWRSDGTTAGTWLVKDINPGQAASVVSNLINLNGMLYFFAQDLLGDTSFDLWRSDGTPAGTTMVQDLLHGQESSAAVPLAIVGEQLLVSAFTPEYGAELYVLDIRTPFYSVMLPWI